jgi:hypothetical protein
VEEDAELPLVFLRSTILRALAGMRVRYRRVFHRKGRETSSLQAVQVGQETLKSHLVPNTG